MVLELSGWSGWKELTETNYGRDYAGAACYELRVRYPVFRPEVVYIGETNCLERRMKEHDIKPSDNVRKLIDLAREVLRVDYHYIPLSSKEDALQLQDEMLGMKYYRWNRILNDPSNPLRDLTPSKQVVRMALGDVYVDLFRRLGI